MCDDLLINFCFELKSVYICTNRLIILDEICDVMSLLCNSIMAIKTIKVDLMKILLFKSPILLSCYLLYTSHLFQSRIVFHFFISLILSNFCYFISIPRLFLYFSLLLPTVKFEV